MIVDYFDRDEKARSIEVPDGMDDRYLPFFIKKQDRRFDRLWRIHRDVDVGSESLSSTSAENA